jgi:hypothetical protein
VLKDSKPGGTRIVISPFVPAKRSFVAVGVALLMLAFIALPKTSIAAVRGVAPDLTWGTTARDQDRTASVLNDIGARWVRLNASWANAEPLRGKYSAAWLSRYDRAVALARGAGARIVMLASQSPFWASGSEDSETAPRDTGDFARFMGFLAKRYRGKVEAYEVWNEENIPRFWSTGPDPVAYVRLLKTAYAAIKQADPTATVVFGGLSLNDYAFVERAYESGVKGYFDVMSVHPYACDRPPGAIGHGADGRMTPSSFPAYREVRHSMLVRGDDKPIWFTEFGWSTTTEACGVSEETQADYLTRAYRFVEQDPYVQIAFWYSLRNNYWQGDADTIEARFGLLRTDFSRKPAYEAFKNYRWTGFPPSNAFPPTISGTPEEDRILLADPGTTRTLTQTRSHETAGSPHRPAAGLRISFKHPIRLCAMIKGRIRTFAPAPYVGTARLYVGNAIVLRRAVSGQADARGVPLKVPVPAPARRRALRLAERSHRRPILEVEVSSVLQGRVVRLQRFLVITTPPHGTRCGSRTGALTTSRARVSAAIGRRESTPTLFAGKSGIQRSLKANA